PAAPDSAPAPEAENTPDNPAADDSTPTPLDITLSQLETAIDDSRPEPFKTANKASVTLP
ncbi:MAG: hypothetical protein GX548_00140, partial [Lentisphaerae bacterium]|nr:hypothetical protein [Lentisphaerota bacterium]